MCRLVWTGVAGTVMLALAGCEGNAPAPAPTATAELAPESAPGMTLSNARIQLPAVSGRPGVAYFTVTQASGAPRSIAAVSVAGAGRAEMHRTSESNGVSSMAAVDKVEIEPGKTVEFAPGGYHVMLFELDPKLRFEDTAEVTVSFDNGDKASAKAKVRTVNEMEGMD